MNRILSRLALAGAFAAAAQLSTPSPAAARETALVDVLSALEQVRPLRMMEEGKTYALTAGGVRMNGRLEDFLRRRTPEEILASGLSTGCGDYAAAFYRLLEKKGLELRYVDAAALNYQSLTNFFDGHTAVAVKDKDSGNWILVDPTFGKIVDADWDPRARFYVGPAGRFWIGYVGPLEGFPAKGPDALKKFYAETLKSVPRDVWEKILIRFEFTIDASMKRPDGTYTNPHVLEFVRRPEDVAKTLGIVPTRVAKVKLIDGGDAQRDDCAEKDDGRWTCTVSRRAAMSPGMSDWLAEKILR